MAFEIGQAEEYQLFGHPGTEMQDCNFLVDVFNAHGNRIEEILDIACGTGRHAIEMAKRGYQVTGVDISADMLGAARDYSLHSKAAVTFVQQDMVHLSFREKFDAAYILFNTISLLISNDDLIQFMEAVHSALKPGGLFILETGNLWPFIAKNQLGNAIFSSDEENGGIRRHRETEIIIGPYNNVMSHQNYQWYWRGEEELGPKTDVFYTRIFSFNELDLLCRLTGFQMIAAFGSADMEKKLLQPNKIEKLEEAYRSYVLVLEY
ncbi:MAG: class I SAM-dependent methyltransferase [Omnitrophica WOR_2 bacterium]